MEIIQNIPVNIELTGSTNFFKSLTQNNIKSLHCYGKNATGDVYIRTVNGPVVDNEQIELYFNGTQNFLYEDINMPIHEGIYIANTTTQEIVCNFFVNDYEANYIQKQVQDYGLSIINFAVIILIFISPFIYFGYLVKNRKEKETLSDNNNKNEK